MIKLDFGKESQNIIHFTDLAEIRSGHLTGNEDISAINTEFVFTTTGTYCLNVKNILSLGFKEVGAMKNWHWTHHNEWTKPIRLFWKRVKPIGKKYTYPTPNPSHFMIASENKYKYHHDECLFLQKNGCGLKVGDHLSRRSFYRYFTLLRMPVKPSKHQLRWLKAANYRLIDTGAQASYWNNGWESAADWSVAKEQDFWRERGICWKEDTDFTYHYREGDAYTPGLRVRMYKHIRAGGYPHDPYLDPTVCPEKVNDYINYVSNGIYVFTPKKSLGFSQLKINSQEYSTLVSPKHFYHNEEICVKCGSPIPPLVKKTRAPVTKAIEIKIVNPPVVGPVSFKAVIASNNFVRKVVAPHRHLYRGGKKCLVCGALRPNSAMPPRLYHDYHFESKW